MLKRDTDKQPESVGRGECSRRRFLQAAAVATAVSGSGAVSTDAAAASDESAGTSEKLFWGELHTHSALSDGNGPPEDHFEIARSHLDFWALADHAFDEEVFDLDYRKHGAGRRLLNEAWGEVQELCRSHEEPGRFVPFLGYEWTNFGYGHHNVYYLDYDQPIRMPATLPELYAELKDVDALVIPHHPGYPVGICGKNWDFHDERLSPFVEIYSLHGSSETPDGVRPLLTAGSWMGPGGAEGCVQAGLARGHKLGIVACSDSHGDHPGAYDLGLTGVYAEELTRGSLWKAFHARRVYAVTGDRIELDFSIDGSPMGSTVAGRGKRSLRISAVAWDKIERVEIVKNNAILNTFTEPAGSVSSGGLLRIRFFVECGWDVRAAHDWKGNLKLPEGRILQAVPCFRGPVSDRKDTGVADLSPRECRWTSKTAKARYGAPARQFANAMAFEIECPEQAPVELAVACDGRERTLRLSPSEIVEKSTLRYVEDVPATNNGAYWHNMETCAKFKVHQGLPTDQLSVELTCDDDPPAAGTARTDCYYVRLIQHNGQRAWSSPIWVESGET